MTDKMMEFIGCTVQVTTPVDVVTGVLVSVDTSCITIRLSGAAGYENGSHTMIPVRSVSYVRFL